jgi:hypothetical protein
MWATRPVSVTYQRVGHPSVVFGVPIGGVPLFGATTGSRKDVLLAQAVEGIVDVELNSALHRT